MRCALTALLAACHSWTPRDTSRLATWCQKWARCREVVVEVETSHKPFADTLSGLACSWGWHAFQLGTQSPRAPTHQEAAAELAALTHTTSEPAFQRHQLRGARGYQRDCSGRTSRPTVLGAAALNKGGEWIAHIAHRRLHVRCWKAARRSAGARGRRTGSDERPGPHRCPGSRIVSRKRRAVGWRQKRRARLGLHCSVELCPREHAIMIGIQGVEQRSCSRLTLGQWRRPMSSSRCSHRPTDRRRLCLPSLLCNHRRFGWRTLPRLPWMCDNSSHCLLGWLPLVRGLRLVRHWLLWLLLLM